jgi:hypothetical protein
VTERSEPQDWPLRPWLLAAILGVSGLAIHLVAGDIGVETREGWRAAISALLFFGPLAFAFTLEAARWRGALAFAALVGLVMAGLAWRAVGGAESLAQEGYGFFAGVIATGLALPLFQAGFHRSRWATPYRRVHAAVWSDVIGAAGSLAFVGASWLMLLLLSELFRLLRIDLLRDLLDEGWFGWTWSGAAFGAALGVLRNEAAIIGTLQRVVMTVLALLAVPLAAGLTLFLGAMIVSGPEVLWEATRSATPVLLSCAAGAWVLANAILRDGDAEMSANRALRVAGLVLVLSIFPLTAFAAVSVGTRVAQHGLSPERLWGLVAVAVAVAYGLAWLVAVVRGRRQGAWRERVRSANLHLAAIICGLALLLALPILDFGAISARHQMARLESGAVSAEDFDYEALRWDFGLAGRKALAQLARDGDPVAAKLAREALARKERIYPFGPREGYRLRVEPADPALERLVRDYLRANPWACVEYCLALDLGAAPDGKRRVAILTGSGYAETALPFDSAAPQVAPPEPAAPRLDARSKVELRTIEKRQIFVDGKPFGQPLADAPLEGPTPRR